MQLFKNSNIYLFFLGGGVLFFSFLLIHTYDYFKCVILENLLSNAHWRFFKKYIDLVTDLQNKYMQILNSNASNLVFSFMYMNTE